MDVSKSLKPLEYFSKLYLMFPISGKNGKFIYNNIDFIFTTRLVVAILFAAIFPVIDNNYYRDKYGSLKLTMDTLHTVWYFTKLPICLFATIIVHWKKKSYLEFLNNCLLLDNAFWKLFNQSVPYGKLHKVLLSAIVLTVLKGGIYLCLLTVDYETRSWNILKILNLGVHCFVQQIICLIQIQWCAYNFILKAHLKLLRNYLNTLTDSPIIRPGHLKKNVMQNSYILYNKILRQSNNLTNVFGWQIFFLVPIMLVLILYDTYYVTEINKRNVHGTLHIIFEIFMGMSFLVSVAMPCVRTVNEAKKFDAVLKKIYVGFPSDSQFDKMQNLLAMQVYHCPIRFSAVGVFPLDISLLTCAWSTLTTYFVILVQND